MAETKELIAYCGLYCGDCPNHKGEIADLARDLRKKLREAKFDRTAQGLSKYFKEFKNYEQCYQVLGGMVRLRCKRACRSGGGPPACKGEKLLHEAGHRWLLGMPGVRDLSEAGLPEADPR